MIEEQAFPHEINKNMNPNKDFIYINNLAALHVTDKNVKKFLNEKIGHKNWITYNELFIPEAFGEQNEHLNLDFFHGVAVSQFSMIQRGGTFINPMLYAMNMDFKKWNHILHNEADFRQHVRYIEVPYELYAEAAAKKGEQVLVEDDYKAVTDSMVKMVDQIKDNFYVNSSVIH